MRCEMVKNQIEARGIRDSDVLAAMRTVERHKFVPMVSTESAYANSPLPIGYGQTISQPFVVAFMTEYLKLNQSDSVLEIGTGSGYQAAILAELVKDVYSIEIVPELAISAEDLFVELGYTNISVKCDDGYHGWSNYAPFEAIIVTAAAETVPKPLIQQLKDGGRMIIPIGPKYLSQELMLIQKVGADINVKSVLPVRFVPFTRSQ